MHVTEGREGREAAFEKMTGDEIRMTVLLRIMWGTMNGKGGAGAGKAPALDPTRVDAIPPGDGPAGCDVQRSGTDDQ